MDDAEIRDLWEATLPPGDPAELDPGATYAPTPAARGTLPPLPRLSLSGAEFAQTLAPCEDTTATVPPPAGEDAVATLPPTQAYDTSAQTLIETHDPAAQTLAHAHTPVPLGEASGVPSAPSASPAGSSGPGYELREVIGRGGMGVVYRAHQSSLGRDVAIKTVLPRAGATLQERFLAEAQITGRLDHPNIVPVHDLGLSGQGEAILAMKLVEGSSWKSLLHPKTPAEEARGGKLDHLRVLISVCQAMAFAHSRGLIHNDLKPENVMLGEFGEVLVMDWGLALDYRDDTPPGDPVPHKRDLRSPCGTPAYMAPELACGEGERLGPWTDVYLLGAILYEIITGAPPHRGSGIHGVIAKAIKSTPPSFPDGVPDELQGICRRALAREPEERFPSARAVQEALEDYLQHRESRRIEASARAELETCRRDLGAGVEEEAARSALYTRFAAAVAGFAQARLLWAENAAARAGEAEARRAYAEAALGQGDLGLAAAQAEGLVAGPERAELVGRIAAARAARERARRAGRILRWALGAALLAVFVSLSVGYLLVDEQRARAERGEARAREEAIRAAEEERKAKLRLAESLVARGDAFGSHGRWSQARGLYVEARALLRELEQPIVSAELGLLEAERHAPPALLDLEGAARRVVFTPDGSELLAVDPGLRRCDPLLGRLRGEEVEEGVTCAAAGPRGALALGCADGRVLLRGEATGRLRTLAGHLAGIVDLRFTPDGKLLVSACQDGSLRTWDVAGGTERHTLVGPDSGPVRSVALTPSGRGAYALTRDGSIRIWNLERGSQEWVFADAAPQGTCLAGSPRERRLAVGARDHTVTVWRFDPGRNNLAPGEPLRGHRGPVQALRFAPDGDLLLSGGADGQVILWRSSTGERLRSLDTGDAVEDLAMSASGGRVAVAGTRAVRLWDLGLDLRNPSGAERGRAALRLRESGDAGPPRAVAAGPEGRLVASGAEGGELTLWDAQTGLPLLQRSWHRAPIVTLAFPDAERLLSVSRDGAARLSSSDGETLHAVVELGPAEAGPWVAAAAPDGRRLVGGSANGAWVVDWTGQRRALAAGRPVQAVAWSPDGARLALGHPDGALSLGPPEGPLRALGPTARPCRVLAFSPRGELVSGHEGGELIRWDGTAPSVLQPAGDALTALRFSGDGSLLFAASVDGSWRAWAMPAGRLLREVSGRGPLHDLALGPGDAQLLSAGADGLLRWGLDRPRRGEAEASALRQARRALQADSADPAARAALGSYYAFRGELRAAARLLGEARAAGARVPVELLVRTHWELGQHAAALRVLPRSQDVSTATSGWLSLLRRTLAEREREAGSRVGRAGGGVGALLVAPEGLVVGTAGGELSLWAPDVGRRLRILASRGEAICSLALSPAGILVAGDKRGTVTRWELVGGRRVDATQRQRGAIDALCFRAGGELLTASRDRSVVRWSAEGEELHRYAGHRRAVQALAVSADGRRAASAAAGGVVKLWDLEGNAELASWQADRHGVGGLAFTAAGRLLVACWRDRVLRLYDPGDARLLTELPAHGSEGLVLAPDGVRAASWTRGELRVWDLPTEQELARWTLARPASAVAFSRDGQALFVAEGDGHLVRRALPQRE